jgi:hypothetical protein
MSAAGQAVISVARGDRGRLPGAGSAAVRVPAGHAVDELALAPGDRHASVAWIESWFDSQGQFESEPVIADLGRRPVARGLQVANEPASSLTFSGNRHGDEVIAWKTCDSTNACAVRAAIRRAGRRFGAPSLLGPIDASQSPAAAIGPAGDALVGWIDAGHVVAATHPLRSSGFSRPRRVSSTNGAADLTVGFNRVGDALAVWTQGTGAPSVIGAAYRR